MTEKCSRCGFPLDETNQFIVMDNESYCMGCYKQITQFREKEKALYILAEAENQFKECSKQLSDLTKAFDDCTKALKYANINLNRTLNEEENKGNIHKKCEWYNEKNDSCRNYMMGKYTGLAFEVSRHKDCIKEMVKE